MFRRLAFSAYRLITLSIIVLASQQALSQMPIPHTNVPPIDLPTKESLLEIKAGEITYGDPKAPVQIIEYASYSCSHCADFYIDHFPDLKKRYIDTGKVYFAYRDFPLNEPAMRASMIVACAPEDKAEKFTHAIFTTQDNWVTKKNYLEVLSNIAKLGGMKQEHFESCIADHKLERTLAETRFFAAKVLEVNSTPTLFINGTKHEGAKDIDSLALIIDPLLKPKDTSKPKE